MRLTRTFLSGPVLDVALGLLGCLIETDEVAVRLTEVEGYSGLGLDPASHAHRGPTPRTQVMFGPAGHAYVYFSYGMHWCLNVVTGPEGEAAAVLVRAGQVVRGLELARVRRPAARSDVDLARGPARLCAALGIDGTSSGLDLLESSSAVRLVAADLTPPMSLVRSGHRVGVSEAATRPWRFWLDGEPSVSQYRTSPRRAPE